MIQLVCNDTALTDHRVLRIARAVRPRGLPEVRLEVRQQAGVVLRGMAWYAYDPARVRAVVGRPSGYPRQDRPTRHNLPLGRLVSQEAALTAVLAHEFWHIHQWQRGQLDEHDADRYALRCLARLGYQ